MSTLRKLLWLRSPNPSNFSVLVVDDDPDIRAVTKVQLETFGFTQLQEAASGEEALNLVHLSAPDLIILDYMMPGMDGARVASYLRLMSPDSVIVAFSGVIDTHPEWADGFVPKLWVDRVPEIAFDVLCKIREGTESGADARAMSS